VEKGPPNRLFWLDSQKRIEDDFIAPNRLIITKLENFSHQKEFFKEPYDG